MDDKIYHGPAHGGPHFHSGPPGKRGLPGVSPKIEVGEVEDGNIPITVTDGYGQRTTDIPIGSVVTDERLTEKVDDWLDEHPEATTTVQDGSITVAKFHSSVVDSTLTQSGHPADAAAVGETADGLDDRLQLLEEGAPEIISAATQDWLDDHVTPTGSAVIVDNSLTQSGAAADAKVTGDEVRDLKSEINYTKYGNLYAPTSYEVIDASGTVKTGNARYITVNDDGSLTMSSSVSASGQRLLRATDTKNVLRVGKYTMQARFVLPQGLPSGIKSVYLRLGLAQSPKLISLKTELGGSTELTTQTVGWATATFELTQEERFCFEAFPYDMKAAISSQNPVTVDNLDIEYISPSILSVKEEISEMSEVYGINLHPGYINASGGITVPSATNKEVYTDKIQCDFNFDFTLSLTYAASNTMWVAYALYDENEEFLTRITLDAGEARTSNTYAVKIGNESARYISFTFRTHGDCETVIISPQYTSILGAKINSAESRLGALENEIQLSATSVRSVNHRGYNTVAPENTLPAYKLSRKMGFDTAETDVAFTSDGVAVLLHDGTINRTARNADGTEISSSIDIGTITYEQALQYDFGIWKGEEYSGTKIPTFEQFIILCKRIGLSAYVELKPTGTTEARVHGLIDTVRNCGMSDCVTWISFYSNLLTFVKNYDSTARIGLVTESVTAETIQTANGLKTDDNEVFIDSDVYSSSVVGTCSSAGIPLEVWTINNQTTMENLDPYITGATSDSLIFGRILYNKYIT